ncbi:MAG: hypothetical protein BWY82_02460 [Verrucomicrobia bacterium ADurb.Bin474]|nr:MAG: hypothetical protein BWY82_02460 [Verrucomicrobia bacterium ADurb.Bin474]
MRVHVFDRLILRIRILTDCSGRGRTSLDFRNHAQSLRMSTQRSRHEEWTQILSGSQSLQLPVGYRSDEGSNLLTLPVHDFGQFVTHLLVSPKNIPLKSSFVRSSI